MADDNDDAVKNAGTEPKADAAAGTFRILISLNGIEQGWWIDAGGTENWITLTANKSDASIWHQVVSGKTYLSTGTNYYLSYRTSSTGLKMRGWVYAAAWQLVGTHLKCVDNGKFVTMDGNYFYANGDANGDNLVDVKYVQN
jgi:hypothetical protein